MYLIVGFVRVHQADSLLCSTQTRCCGSQVRNKQTRSLDVCSTTARDTSYLDLLSTCASTCSDIVKIRKVCEALPLGYSWHCVRQWSLRSLSVLQHLRMIKRFGLSLYFHDFMTSMDHSGNQLMGLF